MSASNSIDRKKLTRAIKLAKVHEIHRLTRKMKQLKAKKGTEEQLQKNQRKANNLVNHMDIIKDFDPDHVVTAILDDDVDKQDVYRQGMLFHLGVLYVIAKQGIQYLAMKGYSGVDKSPAR
ncbi:uncharacterized protein TRIADDRAFT_52242 [Trichoplax adhaerens]|uniref:Uncharacterized protein n=1 Tax=Trichoplax adhaerens TaxID=10228 RepID=B3RM56_TRIAD|nr:hypothetical protein TRIADDRAFT_52242 [Trichoplax adhaerens]EDV29638.1 hypothetical protein TRIADDRAFT_52242 [Trichoplax adhaerens]|eukprot:XP_002108840.1 hypothetical protein TRIADDRAFT_52242 [Trichoplax adhaerens]